MSSDRATDAVTTAKPSQQIKMLTDVVQNGRTLQASVEFVHRLKLRSNSQKFCSPEYRIGGIVPLTLQAETSRTPPTSNMCIGASGQYHCKLYVKIDKDNIDGMKTSFTFTSAKLNVKNKHVNENNGGLILLHEINQRKSCKFCFDIKLSVEFIDKTNMFESMYDDTELTDIELCGVDGTVSMHKCVMASSSPVFKRMLSQDWKGKDMQNVTIEGTSQTTLKHLKSYIYLRKIPSAGLEQLLLLASCYMIPGLEYRCIEKLVSTVTPENFTDLLEFAVKNQITKLYFAILECVQSKTILVNDIKKHNLLKRKPLQHDNESSGRQVSSPHSGSKKIKRTSSNK